MQSYKYSIDKEKTSSSRALLERLNSFMKEHCERLALSKKCWKINIK